ncbi:hypothetical protein MAR_002948 [Mya arenaria]|uniref:Uncharacterized protein n=1 Tax=Mya arenaria TaxID=6604 RepID=A0ABY7G4L8_MYAAR|nr:hypothetical protein MAR_002948 [Mya arenaria]
MAQKTKVRNDNSIFWSNIGLSSKGNRRPGRLKGRKTTEVKAQVPLKQPLTLLETVVNDLPERDTEKKVGDEKEKAVQELHGEREHYEKQLITMDLNELQQNPELDKAIPSISAQNNMQSNTMNQNNPLPVQFKTLPNNHAQKPVPYSSRQNANPVLYNAVQNTAPNMAPYGYAANMAPAMLYQKFAPSSFVPIEVVVSQSSSDRKSRSRVPAHRLSANQKHSHELWTNQNGDDNDSVSDLLLNSKDPRDNVKRPFTSLIDKEIAKERSLSRGSQRSDISGRSQGSDSRSERSRSRSPSEGRPKFAYPEKLISLGPLHEPIASSTHKSMEIKAQMSNNFDLESVRSSIQGQGQRYESKGNKSADCHAQNDKQNSKVVFSGKDEYDDEGEIHSPNLKATSKLFNDPEYAVYYKKLSPGGRKRELLKQRQALLMEQENLKGILEKQERQLKERQYEYTKRQELQKERMEFYQKGGKFPAFKLNFDEDEAENGENPGAKNRNEASDGEIDEDEDFEELERGSEGGYVRKEDQGTFEKYNEEVQIQSRISAGASPMTTPTKVKVVTKVTSPATSQESEVRSQRSVRSTLGSGRSDTGSGAPRGVDAATSISYREKTLNVLEIVNSMDEGPSTPIQRQFEELENFPSNITPTRGGTKKTVASSRPPRQYSTKLLDDSEESAEESKILEDIFFL